MEVLYFHMDEHLQYQYDEYVYLSVVVGLCILNILLNFLDIHHVANTFLGKFGATLH